jgi:hypothetical protein
MVLTQIKELVYKNCAEPLTALGFEVKPNKAFDLTARKKRNNGFDSIAFAYNVYGDTFFLLYALNKTDNRVNKILLELQEKVKLDFKVEKQSPVLFFSYNTLHDPSNSRYLPEMKTEQDVSKCVDMMMEFISTTAMPLFDKFEDLRELDAIINGDNSWETDWHKPYTLGGNFYEKRLIIARLAGNPHFEKLVDFNYKTLEKLSAENGSPFTYDRDDCTRSLPLLVTILKQVEPVY